MPRQPVGAGIERPRLKRRTLVGLLARQVSRKDLVTDRKNPAVSVGAQANALNGIGAVRRDVKHLLPGQRRFHRALELSRRDCRQDGVGVHP